MDTFRVWSSRTDGATCLRVDGFDNATWLLRRLGESFVFKTCEPLRGISNTSAYTFRVADNSQLSSQQFQRLLASISEVHLIVEPPLN
jgi:hypothetical protein